MKLQEIITAVQEYHPDADTEIIRRADQYVRETHQGQTRASGEPYVTHVTEVAYLTTKLKLDVASIVTGLLHDTVEDTDVTLNDIEVKFDKEVAQLVDGVTKLSKVNFSSRAEQQAENFRKMLLAMAQDIRVLLIKLCDRVHNMRTLEFLSDARRKRIAQETIDIYAPLAHRLGIHWMKSELEDLSFRYLRTEIYENIKTRVSAKRVERERYIKEVVNLLTSELAKNNITGDVSGRPKHFYSIYQKMEQQGLEFDEVHDLTAFRVIVSSTMDCYGALGVVHAAWKPIPGRFKDYIAMPKANDYQSLHTTVIGPKGERIEIQIRTEEMHSVAERGIAAHWAYKDKGEGGKATSEDSFQFPWLKDLVESGKLVHDPREFMAVVKDDLFPNEVYVFSPKGDLIALPTGATPIDFAYNIHTEVGNHCSGARINGQQVPLSYQMKNGDTVEITTSNNQAPSKDWLNIVVTSKAKQRVRSWLRAEERNRSVAVGKELLVKDLRRIKLSYNKVLKGGELKKAAESFGLKEVELLLAEIGYGKLSTRQVAGKLLPDTPEPDLDEKLAKEETALQKIFQKAAKVFKEKSGVRVSGMEDMVFRFARCCEPLPGDELIGYVTRGRGVTVHRRNCGQVMSFDPRRLIPVSWEDNVQTVRCVKLRVITRNRVGMLAQLSLKISGNGADINSATATVTQTGKAIHVFNIDVTNSTQLNTITHELEGIDGVITVERQRQGEADKS